MAACMVVFYHYFQNSSGLGPVHAVIVHGYMAVDLFFILSGFVMALTYAPAFAHAFSLKDYATFLGKRMGRIYPLYFVITVLVAGLIFAHAIDGGMPSAGTIISNILMVQAWGFADSIGGPTWSISTEFAAYLLFPLLVTAVLGGRALRCWIACLCSLAVLVLLASRSAAALHQLADGVADRNGKLDIFGTATPFPLLRCLAGFVLGLAAFRLSGFARIAGAFRWRHAGDLSALVVLALWTLHGTDILLELAFVPLVMALASGGSWTAGLLGSGIVFWLGEISYSIYLVHRPVENLLRRPLMAALDARHVPHAYTVAGLLPLILAGVVAAATFTWIEKPARDWSRRLMRSKPPPIEVEPYAP